MNERENKAEFITHLLNGNNALLRDELEMAIEEYQTALELNPRFFLTYAKLGRAFYKNKEYEQSIIFFRKSLDINPEQTGTLYQLGKAYHQAGMNVQAAVAYDMALEKDKGGDYSSAIQHRKRKIRRHSSGRSLNDLLPGEVLARTLNTFIVQPALMLPFILATVIMFGSNIIIHRMLDALAFTPFTPMSAGHIFISGDIEINPSAFVYYCFMLLVVSFICAPLYSISIIKVNAFQKKQSVPFTTASSRAFSQLSHLGSFTLLFLIAIGVSTAASVYVADSLTGASQELIGFLIPLRLLAALVIPLASPYLIYAVPCIVIEKQQMEKGIKKGLRFGRKYANITSFILFLYIAANILVDYTLGDYTIAGFELKKNQIAPLLMVPLQTLLAIAITVIFRMGQEVKKKSDISSESRIPFEQQIDDIDDEIPELS